MTKKITQGLKHVSAIRESASLMFEDGTIAQLDRNDMERLLLEIANNAPDLLHDALETRLVSRIIAEIQYTQQEEV